MAPMPAMERMRQVIWRAFADSGWVSSRRRLKIKSATDS